MKLLTKEEEASHYRYDNPPTATSIVCHNDTNSCLRAVVKGGTIGGVLGLIGGTAGVMAAARRYHTIRSLTLPMKAFLVTSTGTFVGIIAADHSSRQYEAARNQNLQYLENREERLRREELASMSFTDRMTAWARAEKYKIIGITWIASIVGSFVVVGRNPYLTGQQKIVQARVYAQGLTLAVMCASAAFEIHDQRKGQGLLDATKKGREAHKEQKKGHAPLDRKEGDQDLWKDMVAAEEEKLRKGHRPIYEHEIKEKHQKEKEAEQKKDEKEDDDKESKDDEKQPSDKQ